MKIRWQKYLDLLATIFGTVGGVAQLLVVTNRLSQDDGLLISGLATIALGIVANKGKLPYTRPYDPPNYFPLNQANYDSPPYNDPYYELPTAQAPLETNVAPTQTPYKSPYESSTPTPNSAYQSKYNRAERSPRQRQSDRPIDSARNPARFKRNTGKRLKTKCEIPKNDD
ncbi:hypothetical protein [Microcoleus sp. B3-D7]|uniref:hypothetical protein n=1 Tax=Microcoleus sp. B3-D7 TaxID=2818659 RepID=UPI002FCF1B55